jgi:hypothetical protein
MPKSIRYYYYKIYDDREQLNYIKSTFEQKAIRKLLKKFEKTHQEYYTTEFLKALKSLDPKAELIDVMTISF